VKCIYIKETFVKVLRGKEENLLETDPSSES